MIRAIVHRVSGSRPGTDWVGRVVRSVKRLAGAALVFLCAGALLVSSAGSASADNLVPIYVGGASNQYGVITIDLTTGTSSFASLGTTADTLAGMGFTSNPTTLYALSFEFGGLPANLLKFNDYATSAATTNLGDVGQSAVGATVRSDGTMFALDQTSPSLLYKLNPPSTSSTSIGTTTLVSPGGLMAFDSGGNLFATNQEVTGTNTLYQFPAATVDTSAAAVLKGPTNNGLTNVSFPAGTFATDSNGNTALYGFGADLEIYQISTVDASLTPIASYDIGMGDVVFAAAVPSLAVVPEPSSLILFGGITLGLAGYAWRKRAAVS